jgi:hypothetical protein
MPWRAHYERGKSAGRMPATREGGGASLGFVICDLPFCAYHCLLPCAQWPLWFISPCQLLLYAHTLRPSAEFSFAAGPLRRTSLRIRSLLCVSASPRETFRRFGVHSTPYEIRVHLPSQGLLLLLRQVGWLRSTRKEESADEKAYLVSSCCYLEESPWSRW